VLVALPIVVRVLFLQRHFVRECSRVDQGLRRRRWLGYSSSMLCGGSNTGRRHDGVVHGETGRLRRLRGLLVDSTPIAWTDQEAGREDGRAPRGLRHSRQPATTETCQRSVLDTATSFLSSSDRAASPRAARTTQFPLEHFKVIVRDARGGRLLHGPSRDLVVEGRPCREEEICPRPLIFHLHTNARNIGA